MAKLLKSEILNRVDERLKALKVSERSVSMKAHGNPDVIRNWRTKDVLPRLDSILQIAAALRTTPEWLAFGAGSQDKQRVPKISWISAGEFGAPETVHHFEDFPTIEVADLPSGDWVALEVIGDSMDRISPEGSIILVNRADKRLVNNACYVFQDGEGGATYKRFRQSPTRLEPVSNNPAHEPIFPENDLVPVVFGRVGRSFIDM